MAVEKEQSDIQALAEIVRTITDKSPNDQLDEIADSLLVIREMLKIQNELLARLPGSLQNSLRGYTGG